MFQTLSNIWKLSQKNTSKYDTKLLTKNFSKYYPLCSPEMTDGTDLHTEVNTNASKGTCYSDPSGKKGTIFKPLIYAVEQKNIQEIKDLLSSKFFNINLPGSNGNTAMHIAANDRNTTILKMLLQAKANTECFDARDERPLHVACAAGNYEGVKVLLKHGVKKDPENDEGQTPLFKAVERDHLSIVKLLLEDGCNARQVDKNGNSLLDITVMNNFISISSLLLKHGALVNRIRGEKQQTVLHDASFLSHAALVTLLGNYGANVNAQNINGDTPLHLGVKKLMAIKKSQDCYQVLKNLFDFKPNVYIKNNAHQDVFDLVGLKDKNDRKLVQLLLYYWGEHAQRLHDGDSVH